MHNFISRIVGDDSLGDALIVCKTSQGVEVQGSVLKFLRFSIAFETHVASSAFRVSEVLEKFQILVQGRQLYNGRAVMRSLIDTGTATVCDATLDESGFDGEAFSKHDWRIKMLEEFYRSVTTQKKIIRLRPEFKIAIADLQMFLMDLRGWLEQVELRINSQPAEDRTRYEAEALETFREPILSMAAQTLEEFERVAAKIEPDGRAMHMNYTKRQIHPLVLCAPFIHRTYFKPLGYAGDYEMVNMMVRNPYEGASLFAKMLNYIFLCTPPVEAHRNRIVYLVDLLQNETVRISRKGHPLRVLNLGCGPAKEIQNFLAANNLSDQVDFTLLDFNDETLSYTSSLLEKIKCQHGRKTQLHFTKKSVHQLLKEATKAGPLGAKYDLIYCAGLFDYLSDTVCKKLLGVFHDMTVTGGSVVATNVAASNPSINWMEYVLDWHLVYRDPRQFAGVRPDQANPDATVVRAIGDGVNIALEIRKN